MAQWDTAYEAAPAGTVAPSTIDDRIRENRVEVRVGANREHVWLDTSQAQRGYHRAGSALLYVTTAAPTTRPDGVALGTADKGRLWMSAATATSKLFIYTGSAWASIGGVGMGYETKSALAGSLTVTGGQVTTIGTTKIGGFSKAPTAIIAGSAYLSCPGGGVLNKAYVGWPGAAASPFSNSQVFVAIVKFSLGSASVGVTYAYGRRPTGNSTGSVIQLMVTAAA